MRQPLLLIPFLLCAVAGCGKGVSNLRSPDAGVGSGSGAGVPPGGGGGGGGPQNVTIQVSSNEQQPLAGATVTLGQDQQVTDAGGSVTFANITRGIHPGTATADGYQQKNFNVSVPSSRPVLVSLCPTGESCAGGGGGGTPGCNNLIPEGVDQWKINPFTCPEKDGGRDCSGVGSIGGTSGRAPELISSDGEAVVAVLAVDVPEGTRSLTYTATAQFVNPTETVIDPDSSSILIDGYNSQESRDRVMQGQNASSAKEPVLAPVKTFPNFSATGTIPTGYNFLQVWLVVNPDRADRAASVGYRDVSLCPEGAP